MGEGPGRRPSAWGPFPTGLTREGLFIFQKAGASAPVMVGPVKGPVHLWEVVSTRHQPPTSGR